MGNVADDQIAGTVYLYFECENEVILEREYEDSFEDFSSFTELVDDFIEELEEELDWEVSIERNLVDAWEYHLKGCDDNNYYEVIGSGRCSVE